jgi:hypothetical protein
VRLGFLSLSMLGISCAEPFQEDRHDLTHFRIAGMRQSENTVSSAVWSGALCHDELPVYEWRINEEDYTSETVLLPPSVDGLAELLVSSSFEDRSGVLTLGREVEAFKVQRFSISIGEDLSLAERLSLEESPLVGHPKSGDAIRLRASVEESVDVRWMTAFGNGTLLEVDAHTVDFIPDEIVFEDNEVIEQIQSTAERFTILALAIDGFGGNQWEWIDIWPDSLTSVWHDGWAIELGAISPEGQGYLSAELQMDPNGEGFLFNDLYWSDDLSVQTHSCVTTEQPFSLDWVVEGRCSCTDIIGKRVAVEVQ